MQLKLEEQKEGNNGTALHRKTERSDNNQILAFLLPFLASICKFMFENLEFPFWCLKYNTKLTLLPLIQCLILGTSTHDKVLG